MRPDADAARVRLSAGPWLAAAMAVALAVFSAVGQGGGGAPTENAAADTPLKKSDADSTAKKTPAADTSANQAKAAADTSAKTLSRIDSTAKKAGADTLAGASAADTSAKKPGADAPAMASAADTSANARQPVVDTSAAASAPAADTSAPARADAGALDSGITVDSLASIFDEFDEPQAAESGLWGAVAANAFYIAFFGVSLAVIGGTLYFYLTRRDTRRFLTTTRLSVLDKMVQKGCRYIESNYSNSALTVADVCAELVTGEAYLDAVFEKELGITVKDFITQVRVNNIKNMLAATTTPDIEKICAECGFPDRGVAEKCFAGLNGGTGIVEFARAMYMEKK